MGALVNEYPPYCCIFLIDNEIKIQFKRPALFGHTVDRLKAVVTCQATCFG